MINITREEIVKRLHNKSGYYQRDIRTVLKALDKVMFDCFNEVDDDDEIVIQLLEGIKITGKVVKSRERIHPTTRKSIIVKDTVKPGVKFSESFRDKIQKNYEDKKSD